MVQSDNMRILFTLLASMAFLIPRAQTHLPIDGRWGVMPWQSFTPYTLSLDADQSSHWQVRPYASVSAGYIFAAKGISYLSAPVGVAFYRPINRYLSAFATASVAPTVFNIRSLYMDPLVNPAGNTFRGLNLNAGVSGGLIYTNEAKTFSISGSINVERGGYPVYVPPYKANTGKQ
jgi:hypothetical protein